MRRAPRKAWERLKDAALLAIDYRIAAELLLLFYEDLADRGQAEPLPVISFPNWHPLNERLSYRHGTLDRNLMDLGISPHPRVVLVIEPASQSTDDVGQLAVIEDLGLTGLLGVENFPFERKDRLDVAVASLLG